MEYNLSKLKEIVCKNCQNKGVCTDDIKCIDIIGIEEIFNGVDAHRFVEDDVMASTIVKDDLIQFVNRIKNTTDVSMDKHLCDHLIWIIEEYYKKGWI